VGPAHLDPGDDRRIRLMISYFGRSTVCFLQRFGIFLGPSWRRRYFPIGCRNSITTGGVFMKSRVVKRSIVVNGHKTSVSLEDEFWSALKVIAGKRLMNLSDLVTAIDGQRQHGNLSSAIRLFVLDFYRSRTSDVEGVVSLDEMVLAARPMAQ
jgi:predicted DNA-binding ribbon-helix-helix protein